MMTNHSNSVLPVTPAAPAKYFLPGTEGVSPQHVRIESLNQTGTCAVCGEEERVASEFIDVAAGEAEERSLTLPLCADCARQQRRAMGKAWWVGIAAALVPAIVLGVLCRFVEVHWVACVLVVAVLLAGAYRWVLPWIGRHREKQIPIVVVSEGVLQLRSRHPSHLAPARLNHRGGAGFYIFGFLTLLSAPFFWDLSMPTLLLDNPLSETCRVAIDGDEQTLAPTKAAIEQRLFASSHRVQVDCPGMPKLEQVFDGSWGKTVLISTDVETCYTSQKTTENHDVGFGSVETRTASGWVQFPLASSVSRTACPSSRLSSALNRAR